MAADFADVFEVRGARRKRRGTLKKPEHTADSLILQYVGLDGILYRTVVRMMPEPRRVSTSGPFWDLRLEPGEATLLEIIAQPTRDGVLRDAVNVPFDMRAARLRDEHAAFVAASAGFACNNVAFTEALVHDLEDLDALRLHVDGSQILGAGIPWFAAPFGRDSILTSLEMLPFAPQLAVETLRTLARYQGEKDDPWREEEPGKMMHELRRGEMTRAGEVPHAPYYGTIDATPLWLILLGETWQWGADRELLETLQPHAERALAWIDRRLREGGGFVRYQRSHEKGLENQGWKDSRDGVSFPDGVIARTPIALVEVQGYVFAAFRGLAKLARLRGKAELAEGWDMRADAVRHQVERHFWIDSSRRGASGCSPSAACSSQKNAPDAHACGEHDTG